MKNNILLSIGCLLICTAFKQQPFEENSAIEKILVSDYRDSYTGVYFCKKATRRLVSANNGIDLTSDTMSIFITKDALDSILNIDLGENTVKAKLTGKKLVSYPQTEHNTGYFFSSDSLDFSYLPVRSTSIRFRGKKQ